MFEADARAAERVAAEPETRPADGATAGGVEKGAGASRKGRKLSFTPGLRVFHS